jgi:hypothetical protein
MSDQLMIASLAAVQQREYDEWAIANGLAQDGNALDAEVPEWMMESPLDAVPEEVVVRTTSAPRGLYDLPIFESFWRADAMELDG